MAENKKESKEKKGAGVPWTIGGDGAGAGAQLVRQTAAITVRGAAQRGLVATVSQFFSSLPGILTLTAMVAGASFYSLWDLNRQREAAWAKQQAAAFSKGADLPDHNRQGSASGSNLDSLSYAASANHGAFGDGNAQAQAAAAPAPAPSAAPADPKADAAASTSPDKNKPADGDGAGQGSMGQALASRYGHMSSGFGGGNGLAGGGGMSSGVGRQFDSKSMVAQLPDSMRHGAASGSSNPGAAAVTSSKRTAVPKSGGGKLAANQLRAASNYSQAAKTAGTSDAQAYTATQAFDGNTGAAGGGSQIGGAGASTGAGPTPSTTGGAGIDQGTPIAQSPSPNNPGTTNSPSKVSGTDVTPWGGLATTAMILIGVATALLIAASLVPVGWTQWIKFALAAIATALAAAATAIGVIIMAQYGQMTQGGILTAVGGILTVIAGIVAWGAYPGASTAATTTATGAGGPATAGTAPHITTV